MNFNDLNPDIHRLIVSHLDKDSIKSLRKLDTCKETYWDAIVLTSKLNYDGPQNSTIFSIASLLEHGPRHMPFVKHLDLFLNVNYDYMTFNQDILLQGLKELNINRGKQFVLTLKICEEIYAMKKVRQLLQSLTFLEILYVGQSFYRSNDADLNDMRTDIEEKDLDISAEKSIEAKNTWKTKRLKCTCDFFVKSIFLHLEILELVWDSVSEQPEESESILLAFQQNSLKKLVTLGPFLTPHIMKILPTNYSLECLSLVGYTNSYYDWSNAQYLQRYCPNIKHFSLQYSNLVTRDLEFFDWSLWNLETLDLSYNYTLRDLTRWPKALTELYVHDTNLDLSTCIGLDVSVLKHVSVDLSATSEWAFFLKSIKNIQTLHMNMKHYLSGVQFQASRLLIGGPWFWSQLKDLKCTVFVRLKEAFYKENILETHGSFLRPWI